MKKVNLKNAIEKIQGFWNPLILGELNQQAIKLAKFKGKFDRHNHENEDEAFLVIQGSIEIEFSDETITLNEGELLIVPKGVDHRPMAENEALVLMFEPSTTVNTGNIVNERTRTTLHRLN